MLCATTILSYITICNFPCPALIHFSQGLPKRGEPPVIPRRGLSPKRGIPNVKKVIAVASGKGGVGKSTIAGLSSIYPTYDIRDVAIFSFK